MDVRQVKLFRRGATLGRLILDAALAGPMGPLTTQRPDRRDCRRPRGMEAEGPGMRHARSSSGACAPPRMQGQSGAVDAQTARGWALW